MADVKKRRRSSLPILFQFLKTYRHVALRTSRLPLRQKKFGQDYRANPIFEPRELSHVGLNANNHGIFPVMQFPWRLYVPAMKLEDVEDYQSLSQAHQWTVQSHYRPFSQGLP